MTGGTGVLLIVLGGNRGSGFSMQAEMWMGPHVSRILRETADKIDESLAEEKAEAAAGQSDGPPEENGAALRNEAGPGE
jgi:hypothetical protein